MDALTHLLELGGENAELVKLVCAAMQNSNYENHTALRHFLIENAIDAEDYFKKYEEFDYVVGTSGEKLWMRNGVRHRDDDLPAEVWADGSSYWFQNGVLHRTEKLGSSFTLPAVIMADGSYFWYQNGKLHRADVDPLGDARPAVMHITGAQEWFYEGEKYERYTLSKKLKIDGEIDKVCSEFEIVDD